MLVKAGPGGQWEMFAWNKSGDTLCTVRNTWFIRWVIDFLDFSIKMRSTYTPPKFQIAPQKWWLDITFLLNWFLFRGKKKLCWDCHIQIMWKNASFLNVVPVLERSVGFLHLATGGFLHLGNQGTCSNHEPRRGNWVYDTSVLPCVLVWCSGRWGVRVGKNRTTMFGVC